MEMAVSQLPDLVPKHTSHHNKQKPAVEMPHVKNNLGINCDDVMDANGVVLARNNTWWQERQGSSMRDGRLHPRTSVQNNGYMALHRHR